MKHWSVRQVFALFLAVFVTAGIGLSFAQASDMTAKMAMGSQMGASDHDGCNACTPVGDNSGKAMTCISGCVAPVFAVLPQAESVAIGEVPIFSTALHPSLHGTQPPPNPSPPRTTDIV